MMPDDLAGMMAALFIIFAVAVVLLSLLIYLIPAIVAFYRDHDAKWVVLILNVAAGWTFIAWIALFVWAIWPEDAVRHSRRSPWGNVPTPPPYPAPHGLSPEAHLAAMNRLQDLFERGLLTRDEFRAHMKALLDPAI
ncbi:superinfection immunity protein [Asaia krungthepensis]|uniref:SHOCT domain-containing protein n=1 Tax=Asaia krungthepensis NRIC 0535 TaxID=1307925 RepID=A0ABQ0PYQ2_9PROT|nr:superinfection immunity protein [Asaia krungthepensis]GBQ84898.1 hypothetical protein AA0535_0622 [Asaia krungthepensis NRIC 0535]